MSKSKSDNLSVRPAALMVAIALLVGLLLLVVYMSARISALKYEQEKLGWLTNGNILTDKEADQKKALGLVQQQDRLIDGYLKSFTVPDGLRFVKTHRTTLQDAGVDFVKPQMEFIYSTDDSKSETRNELIAALKQDGFGVEPYEDGKDDDQPNVMGWGHGIRIYATIGLDDGKTTLINVEWDK